MNISFTSDWKLKGDKMSTKRDGYSTYFLTFNHDVVSEHQETTFFYY